MNNEITVRQYLQGMKKHCLATRIMWLMLGLFAAVCVIAVQQVVIFSTQRELDAAVCVYKSTVELDTFKDKNIRKMQKRYLGLPDSTHKNTPL